MISADGVKVRVGKGIPPRIREATHAPVFGRDENIGATVIGNADVALLDILTFVTVLSSAVIFYLYSKIHT